ncbi:MAG TPA: hypothetical protein VH207_08495 [Chthoniobacterales bacterium]|nr:hypothetical protein [Chthoniobacterales bacterium]
MKTSHLPNLFLAVPFVFLASPALAQQAPISIEVVATFDYPGDVTSTIPQKINDAGEIAGDFVDSSGVERGFVRFRDGTFSAPIDFPGIDVSVTQARGVNNPGTVCGYYISDNFAHGYFLSGGVFTPFDLPGAVNTYVDAINDAGDFAGTEDIPGPANQGYASIGGTIVTYIVPGSTNTNGSSINNSGQIAGYYLDGAAVFHGFSRGRDGTLTFPLDPPGSTSTFLFGNNDRNIMVGRYVDGAGTAHGFFLRLPASFLTFDYPGATFTSLNGINRKGIICGRYTDSAGLTHGLVARLRR